MGKKKGKVSKLKKLGSKLQKAAQKIERGRASIVESHQKMQKKVRKFSEETGIGQQGAADLLGFGGGSVDGDDILGLAAFRRETPKKKEDKKKKKKKVVIEIS